MSYSFILSCESTVDIPYALAAERDIEVISYSYSAGGREYPDDMGRDPYALPRFYEQLRAGTVPSTSQINEYRYHEYFRGLLEKGDVLHIAFSSGLTPSVRNAERAAEQLRREFPQRRLIVIDSLCGSSGYGLLTLMAADMRDAGADIDVVARRTVENRLRVHHEFYTTEMRYLRRSGRICGPAAAVASIMNICPLMRLDAEGRIVAYDKARGTRAVTEHIAKVINEHTGGAPDKIFISHADCEKAALALRGRLAAEFPRAEISIFSIGTIIASHCGPGTVAVYFVGDERK